jgi:hypothetical protein
MQDPLCRSLSQKGYHAPTCIDPSVGTSSIAVHNRQIGNRRRRGCIWYGPQSGRHHTCSIGRIVDRVLELRRHLHRQTDDLNFHRHDFKIHWLRMPFWYRRLPFLHGLYTDGGAEDTDTAVGKEMRYQEDTRIFSLASMVHAPRPSLVKRSKWLKGVISGT